QASAGARCEARSVADGYEDVPASHPDPEQLNVMKQGHARRVRILAELSRRCARDKLVQKLIRLIDEDVTDATEQATRRRVSYDEARNARRRLAYALEQLLREEAQTGAALSLDEETT